MFEVLIALDEVGRWSNRTFEPDGEGARKSRSDRGEREAAARVAPPVLEADHHRRLGGGLRCCSACWPGIRRSGCDWLTNRHGREPMSSLREPMRGLEVPPEVVASFGEASSRGSRSPSTHAIRRRDVCGHPA